jgi:CBS domain containing-hemolysin-like protein
LIRDILTPRVVVLRLDENTPLSTLKDHLTKWSFSRIPLYSEERPDSLTGYVTRVDILQALVAGNHDLPVATFKRQLLTVPELMTADTLLTQFIERNERISAVVDEHGALAGVVTLEDLIEELLGHEITDEYDQVRDLRSYAREGKRKGKK